MIHNLEEKNLNSNIQCSERLAENKTAQNKNKEMRNTVVSGNISIIPYLMCKNIAQDKNKYFAFTKGTPIIL